MIGIYERVSTTKQDTASQHGELEAWAANKEGVRWYEDAFTGKSMDRPGLNHLLADVRSGKVKTVVVWRLDRLGRTAGGLCPLMDDFVARKVNLVSLRDGLDLSTPTGKLVLGILASIAGYETEVRAERVAAGLAAKRQRVEAGLETWDKGGRPKGVRQKVTDDIARGVKQENARGTPKARIARMFHLSRPTVYSILAE